MAKTRVTLTLESDEDAAVRAAAEEEGLDLSAFLRVAALAEVARISRTRARFAEVDEVSRAAEEAQAEQSSDASPAADAAMDAYLDAIDSALTRRGGGAAA
ncbi:ribbon-helix-helix protein, CopG family [Streptomyces polygonati]|uniref:Ribbon-helix-helix protein, CopG family n=1 Tax=Streptomyces polygonati TaxID=1617087 RepID=A0ABV8HL78_9ACTN